MAVAGGGIFVSICRLVSLRVTIRLFKENTPAKLLTDKPLTANDVHQFSFYSLVNGGIY